MKKVKRETGTKYIGVGVGALIINNNEILLLLRNVPPEEKYWSIPGGTVEFGEKLEDALKRELKEELNILIEVDHLLCVTDHIIENSKVHWVSPAYLVKIVKGVPKNNEINKHLEMKWFNIDDLPENLAIPAISAISSYKKSNSNSANTTQM